MKNEEKSLVKLNPEIIEQFENGEEMMLVKGGISVGSIWEKICDAINFNCDGCEKNKNNCDSCTTNNCNC